MCELTLIYLNQSAGVNYLHAAIVIWAWSSSMHLFRLSILFPECEPTYQQLPPLVTFLHSILDRVQSSWGNSDSLGMHLMPGRLRP